MNTDYDFHKQEAMHSSDIFIETIQTSSCNVFSDVRGLWNLFDWNQPCHVYEMSFFLLL